MARKVAEEWIELPEAVKVMSEKSGYAIAPGYVRTLATRGKITTKPKDGRTNLYLKSSLLAYTVKQKKRKAAER